MDDFDPVAYAQEVETRLRALSIPERADTEKRYLKSTLTHVGVPVPAIRRVATRVRQESPDLSRAEVLTLVSELWGRPVHECRMVAVEVLRQYAPLLTPADMRLVEKLIRDARTWALVDPLAIKVAGDLFHRHAELGVVLDGWARDEGFWIRRAALLALLPGVRSGCPDLDRFVRYAETMLDEREFFIRKALGWVLREISANDPDFVRTWVAAHQGRMSGVTRREASRHLT